MKKLFTFAAAVLFTASLMAQTTVFNWSPTESECVGSVLFGTTDFSVATVKIHTNTDQITALKFNSTYKYADKKYISIKPVEGAFKEGDVVSLSVFFNNADDTKNAIVSIYAPDGSTLLFTSERGINGRTSAADPEIQTYTLEADADSLLLARGSGSNLTATYVKDLYVTRPATCEDPEAHLTFNKSTAYVGDPFSYNYSSKNGGDLNDSYTLNGAPAVQGTDYTFSSGNLTVLKAGQFVMHRTVDEQDGYCAVDVSDTILISEKSPVTSFEIDAPTSARVGDEITIELKNFDAAPTEIHWYDDEFTEITAANGKTSYTFTPEAAGNYLFQITAWNDFNVLNEEAYNYTIIQVVVGNNAYLSDLKVNGETIDGFKDDKFEYDLGEIGVYEIPNVVATPADAPYATAVVNVAATGVLVSVIAQDKTTIKEYIIHFTRKAATERVDVTSSTTWDFTKTGSTEVKFTDETIVQKGVTEFNFADVLPTPDASFDAAALNGIAEYAVRESKYFQGSYLKFKTNVSGKLEVVYSNTGNRDADKGLERILTVNGVKIGDGALRSDTDVTESNIAVSAGEVVISSVLKSDESTQYIRVKRVAFTADEPTAIDNIEAGQVVKAIENGQLVIIKNGVRYNAQGSIVR